MSDSPAADEHNSEHTSDAPAANEQKPERRYETTFVSLPYRRRFFHSFKEMGKTEKIPGSVFRLTGTALIKINLLFQ